MNNCVLDASAILALLNNEADARTVQEMLPGAIVSTILKHQLIYTQELRDALWPAFFETQKRNDRSPVYLRLPDGKVIDLTLEWFGEGIWGSTASPEFWNWLQGLTPQPGDDLIFRVIDGEERHYAVDFQLHSERDEQAIGERNQKIIQATSPITNVNAMSC